MYCRYTISSTIKEFSKYNRSRWYRNKIIRTNNFRTAIWKRRINRPQNRYSWSTVAQEKVRKTREAFTGCLYFKKYTEHRIPKTHRDQWFTKYLVTVGARRTRKAEINKLPTTSLKWSTMLSFLRRTNLEAPILVSNQEGR